MKQTAHTFAVTRADANDKALLHAIYMLRVQCREEKGFITFDKFPDGWYDGEDEQAAHFVVYDCDKLIASGRVNIYDSITDIPAYPALPQVALKPGRTGFLYRNGVLPEYRMMGISRLMNEARESYMKDHGCLYSMGYCHDFQVENFLKHGYRNFGLMDTGLINWDLAPDNWYLMVKELV